MRPNWPVNQRPAVACNDVRNAGAKFTIYQGIIAALGYTKTVRLILVTGER